MNVKIDKQEKEMLDDYLMHEYTFGSHLHGIATEDSDKDYVRVVSDEIYKRFTTLAIYFPNIHSWQFDDVNNDAQYVYMTETQFYRNLFSGDGNMIADIVILSGKWSPEKAMKLCRTYKIVKGYLGVAKRDLKLHGNQEKKRFHAWRSMYMAEKLMKNSLPTVQDVVFLKTMDIPDTEELKRKESELRKELNHMLDGGVISTYPVFKEMFKPLQTMVNSNNVREFKY